MAGNQRGIALLTVLWVLTVLMVIVFSYSYLVRTETLSTLSFKEGLEKRFLAEAGIERGILELFYRKKNLNKVLLEDLEVWKTDGSPYSGQLGDGTYIVKIFDESGKININTASETILKNLIENLDVEGIESETIVDSILDWKDKDDFYRLHGAESDYYQSLPVPYKAKNSNFDTLEELLLIKGVTKELLYGSGKQQGLIHFLTVHGNTGKVNINAAPREVLMAVSGMNMETADRIIRYRQSQEIKSISEIEGVLGQKLIQLLPFTTAASNIFTIESFGYRNQSRSGNAVRATVSLSGNQQYKILYYKTPVSVKHDEANSKPTNDE